MNALSGVQAEVMVAELIARVRCLEDHDAIGRLLAQYGSLADRHDVAGVAALWTEDGVYDVCGYGVHRGIPAITKLLSQQFRQAFQFHIAAHVMSAPVITLDGDSAVAITCTCWLRRGGSAWQAHYVATDEWRLVRTPAGWRVAGRCNRPLDDRAAVRAHTADLPVLHVA